MAAYNAGDNSRWLVPPASGHYARLRTAYLLLVPTVIQWSIGLVSLGHRDKKPKIGFLQVSNLKKLGKFLKLRFKVSQNDIVCDKDVISHHIKFYNLLMKVFFHINYYIIIIKYIVHEVSWLIAYLTVFSIMFFFCVFFILRYLWDHNNKTT